MKLPLGTLFLIIGLSLGVWALFYLKSVALNAAETAVVVGICTALVLSAKSLWARFGKKEKD